MALLNTEYVVAFYANRVDAGAEGVSKSQVGTGGLPGARPCPAVMVDPYDGKNKVFARDNLGNGVVVDIIGNTVTSWAGRVAALGLGALPTDCALVAVYRGRMVHARAVLSPAFWAMSRIGDPYDYDFGADPAVTSAIPGTSGRYGQVGDVINALVTANDDFMLFGGEGVVHMLEGDPGLGGRVQVLTRKAGILNQRAWCFDKRKILYAVGGGGFWRMQVPNNPEPIAEGRLKDLLDRNTDDSVLVQLVYDKFDDTVNIYLTPTDGLTAGVHIIYDCQKDAFLPDQYPLAFGPWAVCETDGGFDQYRRFLIGCNDGYIRVPDETLTSDDSQAINAYFDVSPLWPFGPLVESKITELCCTGGTNAQQANWAWYVGDSADQVRVASTPADSGTFFASGSGFQENIGMSERGIAHRLRVSQNSATRTFSIETIQGWFELRSRTGR